MSTYQTNDYISKTTGRIVCRKKYEDKTSFAFKNCYMYAYIFNHFTSTLNCNVLQNIHVHLKTERLFEGKQSVRKFNVSLINTSK